MCYHNDDEVQLKLPPADIPDATPRASRRPIAIKGYFGIAIISLVTIPARYLRYRIVKYTATYLHMLKHNNKKACHHSRIKITLVFWNFTISISLSFCINLHFLLNQPKPPSIIKIHHRKSLIFDKQHIHVSIIN